MTWTSLIAQSGGLYLPASSGGALSDGLIVTGITCNQDTQLLLSPSRPSLGSVSFR